MAGRLAFLQTGRHTKESRSPAKTQCCEHGSSPSFPKPERKGVKNSNFMSSAGKSHPVEWFYQGARPSDSPERLRHIFGPIAEGRHEELKTRAPSNKQGEVPSLGDPARGKPDPREAREVPQPLAAAQAPAQAAMQAGLCPRQEPAASPLPRTVWKLPCSRGVHSSQRDKRQNNTCWGITSFPQGWEKAMLRTWLMSLMAAAFPGKGQHNPR